MNKINNQFTSIEQITDRVFYFTDFSRNYRCESYR